MKVTLRPLTLGDVPEVYRLTSMPQVAKYMRFDTHQEEAEARALVEEYLEPGNYGFAVISEKGEFVGVMAMKKSEELNGDYTMSAFSHPDFWGMGIFTQVVGLIIPFAREKAGALSLTGHIIEANIGSCRTLEKNGFTLVETLYFPEYPLGLRVYRLML